ncbi:hypothetical protein GWN26_05150, partial [Candidatus Saccharibacteria bacterium]|nr:hypothetical protein [Candidatus Saccharibacteria bacterium]NIW78809.1 hypothetical protein [Calditrichia bacterium]
MDKFLKLFITSGLLVLFSAALLAQSNFNTSLHKTRLGKNYWYGADTSITGAPAPGFESLVNVPIDNLGCVLCHPADNLNANGDPYPTPYPGADCVDCHATASPGMPVTEDDCMGCHGRQAKEIALGYSDVHRTAATPLKCWDCHPKEELHGDDGIMYNSMLEPGAIQADCQSCHDPLPSGHSQYDPHGGALHCDACHAQTVISCYNCHFESQIQAHIKRAKQPIHDFVILVNRAKDGKVGTATFQSLTHQGNAWAAFAPFHSHTITRQGRGCTDCHANMGGSIAAIDDYNADGVINFATWNTSDSTLSWLHGVVPFPEDYQSSFKMEFITYNSDPSDPPGPSKNWSPIGKNTWDGHQLFFATPLTSEQMQKLGMDTTFLAIDPGSKGEVPEGFRLEQNYPNPFNPSTTIDFHIPHTSI